MEVSQVKQIIETGLPGVEAKVAGDGYHYEAIVIGDCFDGKSLVQQQKMVYATLNAHITSGALHAITIKTYTPALWEKARPFQVGSA